VKTQKLYCLQAPSGYLVRETVDTTKRDAWWKSFNFLSANYPKVVEGYYKKWDASIRAARRKGWIIVPVELIKAS
jgi:hypothetical protein